jgi:hypothetical protein
MIFLMIQCEALVAIREQGMLDVEIKSMLCS